MFLILEGPQDCQKNPIQRVSPIQPSSQRFTVTALHTHARMNCFVALNPDIDIDSIDCYQPSRIVAAAAAAWNIQAFSGEALTYQ